MGVYRTDYRSISSGVSYWKIFRLIFVVFSLYLIGDAFYRWDGFQYSASFAEFVPSIALVTILWSIVALIVAFLLWLPLWLLEAISVRTGFKVKVEHMMVFRALLLSLIASVWVIKRTWFNVLITPQTRWIVLICVVLVSAFISWFNRSKAEKWINAIHERTTPLVWLFCAWFICSIPIVAFTTLGKSTDDSTVKEVSKVPSNYKSLPNIMLVTFDALTARNMSVYGYDILTTPFISKWSEKASLFKRLKSQGNITPPTIASFMTGKRMWTHQTYSVYPFTKPIRGGIENMPLMLKKAGYFNMAFVVNPQASVQGLGIEESFDLSQMPSEFSTAASLLSNIDNALLNIFGYKIKLHDWIVKHDFILDIVLRWVQGSVTTTISPPDKAFNSFFEVIDKGIPEPFFAWIHLFPPHDPYLPPAPFMGKLDDSNELRTLRSHQEVTRPITKLNPSSPQYKPFLKGFKPQVNTFRARYDEFIMYCDKQFESLMNQLDGRGILKNTIVIFSSDHGESFDHDVFLHGWSLYESVTHVPLIIKEPGQNHSRIIDDLVEQTDVPATILDFARISTPDWMEGRSLVPLLRGKTLPAKPVFSMSLWANKKGQKITQGTIAIWEDDYKLIYDLGKEQSLLFNLKNDLEEVNNLSDKEPEMRQHLITTIKENIEKANVRISKAE